MSVATAMALKSLCPPTTAVPKATLSAQVPTGYDAFSTFAPSIYWPALVRIVAPTRNCNSVVRNAKWIRKGIRKAYSGVRERHHLLANTGSRRWPLHQCCGS